MNEIACIDQFNNSTRPTVTLRNFNNGVNDFQREGTRCRPLQASAIRPHLESDSFIRGDLNDSQHLRATNRLAIAHITILVATVATTASDQRIAARDRIESSMKLSRLMKRESGADLVESTLRERDRATRVEREAKVVELDLVQEDAIPFLAKLRPRSPRRPTLRKDSKQVRCILKLAKSQNERVLIPLGHHLLRSGLYLKFTSNIADWIDVTARMA